MMTENSTREIAERWFGALTSGDIETALSCLDQNVDWINYHVEPEYNDLMPWIGTYKGVDEVVETFKIFGSLVQVKKEELVKLAVDGEEAAGVIHEISFVKDTGREFEIEFIQWLTIRNGKIVRWKSYTDPSQILRALKPLAAKTVAGFARTRAGVKGTEH
jgi:ketosteroid isomerase-like protein